MAYAFAGALADPGLKLGGVALFLGVVLATHDGIFLPAVIGVGSLLGRVPSLIRAASIVSLAVTLVALPFVLGYGRSADNPSALPLAYGRGLALTLIAIWTVTFSLLMVQRWRVRRAHRRQAGPGRRVEQGNRQEIVRMETTPSEPSDG